MSRPTAPTVTLEQLARLCQMGQTSQTSQNGRADALQRPPAQATGLTQLDQALPGGGLPVGAVTEILSPTHGIGELRIVMPALAQITRNERYVAFVEPPYLPYPPALAQHGLKLERVMTIRSHLSLWASEQLLRCSAFGAVLTWPAAIDDKAFHDKAIQDKEIRRLQLAAEAGGNLAILYRPASAAQFASPAALRLLLHATHDGAHIEIKKCRGGQAGKIVHGIFDLPMQAI